ncbi:MAG: phosphatase PAP2 family protein [Oligoflexales bacterium]|nr:phosphatase PAP2 family protein [Oligoflexales bacterium]
MQEKNSSLYVYKQNGPVPFISNFPKNFRLFYENYLNYDNKTNLIGLTLISAASIYWDEDLLLASQRLGKKLHISSEDKTKSYFTILGLDARFPTDFSSGLYFIGDGWVHSTIALSFLGAGYSSSDQRAWSTGLQLIEGLLTTGFTTQVLKHLTGRESPFVRSQAGGVWRLFPDQIKYHKNVPKHDAFPSGHLATGTMTVVVIAENYPDYPYFIKPLGYTLLSLLSFQMMNNGVHWFGDYPLALALGYGFGQIAVHNARTSAEIHAEALRRRSPPGLTLCSVLPRIYPSVDKAGVAYGMDFHFLL